MKHLVMLAAAAAAVTACTDGRVAELETRLERLEAEDAIRKVAFAYGDYMDNALIDDVTDLFADEVEYCEISGYGLYAGRANCLKIWTEILGPALADEDGGLRYGRFIKHYLVKDIIDVSADGQTAEGRFDYIGYSGIFGAPERTSQQFGVYRMGFVKEDGVWKIGRFSLSFDTSDFNYAAWASDTRIRCPREGAPPPDGPPLFYHPFPETGVIPFHFDNPVSGRPAAEHVSDQRHWQGTGPDDFGVACGPISSPGEEATQ